MFSTIAALSIETRFRFACAFFSPDDFGLYVYAVDLLKMNRRNEKQQNRL